MCKCTPNKRTPWCGAPGCEEPYKVMFNGQTLKPTNTPIIETRTPMKLLHNVGTFKHSNYNTREQVAACREQLSFDGVYLNVWQNRDLLLGREQPTILFVMWNYIGKDNTFDAIPNKLPIEEYCDIWQLVELVNDYNCEIASHSWTHRDLTKLSDHEVREELKLPHIGVFEFPMRYFAYPYGDVDDRVARLTKEAGYQDAWSVNQGNGGPFQRNRTYLV